MLVSPQKAAQHPRRTVWDMAWSLNNRLFECQDAERQDAGVATPRGAEITRQKLLDAAHELLVDRTGGATVAEICSHAQVNVAMVKYCFGSKDEMLDALLEHVLDGLADAVERLAALELSADEKLRRHIAEIVRN